MHVQQLLRLFFLAALVSLVGLIACDELVTESNTITLYDPTIGQQCLDQCHSDNDNRIVQPKGQWANSRHASPDLIEARDPRYADGQLSSVCGPECHIHDRRKDVIHLVRIIR